MIGGQECTSGLLWRAALPSRRWPRPLATAGRGAPQVCAAARPGARSAATLRPQLAARLGLSHVPYLSAARTRTSPAVAWVPCGSRRFRVPSSCEHAADLIPHIKAGAVGESSEISEGPRWEIVVSPGMFRVRTRDYAKAERTHERQVERRRKRIDVDAPVGRRDVRRRCRPAERSSPGRASHAPGWSNGCSDLDYTKLYGRVPDLRRLRRGVRRPARPLPSVPLGCCTPWRTASNRLPAMLTLTYPGDWLTVAPTAEIAMGHFQALCKRYERAWGEPLTRAVEEGVPSAAARSHFHISTTPPMRLHHDHRSRDRPTAITVDFRRWLSITWAEIVAHPDPEERRKHLAAGTGVDYAQGLKLTDPRRMAIYFAKYGAAATARSTSTGCPTEWLDERAGLRRTARPSTTRTATSAPTAAAQTPTSIEQRQRLAGSGATAACAAPSPSARSRPTVGIAAGRIARRWYRAKGLTQAGHSWSASSSRPAAITLPAHDHVRKRLFAHGQKDAQPSDGARCRLMVDDLRAAEYEPAHGAVDSLDAADRATARVRRGSGDAQRRAGCADRDTREDHDDRAVHRRRGAEVPAQGARSPALRAVGD